MKCTATELEIETLNNRIRSKDIDLQPDFQRGEVWSAQKKKKLIDSILRGWRIPPIHVIENKHNFIDEVLDGQQRLATIRDFLNDLIKIDGNLQPIDQRIEALDGLLFSQLELDEQRRFKKYSITIIRLTEYTPAEPAELFYRLNQPASLTSAEQRNAFIGDTRNQVRDLVESFEKFGARKETIGFSNSRMAYDDVISKFCFTLETDTLRKKITSTDISNKYRQNNPFDYRIYDEAQSILTFFMRSVVQSQIQHSKKLSLNKATLYSWLIFVKRYFDIIHENELGKLIFEFEIERELAKGKGHEITIFDDYISRYDASSYPYYENMFLLFNQKASMGSTDVTSIIFRDIILEIFMGISNYAKVKDKRLISNLNDLYAKTQNFPLSIEKIADLSNWGGSIQ